MISRLTAIGGLIAMASSSLTGCQTVPSGDMVPAGLMSADKASMTALKSAAAKVLNRDEVKLGALDLENSPNVSILPERSNSPAGAPFNQRDFAIPTQLLLMTDGKNCFLVKQDTRDLAHVENVECRALA